MMIGTGHRPRLLSSHFLSHRAMAIGKDVASKGGGYCRMAACLRTVPSSPCLCPANAWSSCRCCRLVAKREEADADADAEVER